MAHVEKKRDSALPSVVNNNQKNGNLSVYQTKVANKRAWADVAPMKIGRSVRIASSPESNSELPQATAVAKPKRVSQIDRTMRTYRAIKVKEN